LQAAQLLFTLPCFPPSRIEDVRPFAKTPERTPCQPAPRVVTATRRLMSRADFSRFRLSRFQENKKKLYPNPSEPCGIARDAVVGRAPVNSLWVAAGR